MRAGFSELQFAYGCTREIENGRFFAGIGVPYSPSLRIRSGTAEERGDQAINNMLHILQNFLRKE